MVLNLGLPADSRLGVLVRSGSRLSLASRFLLVAGAVISGGMALLGYWVSSIVERRVVSHASATIAVYVETLLEPHRLLLRDGQGLSEAEIATLDELLQRRLLGTRVRDLKIWYSDGRVVYSTNHVQIGKTFEVTSDLKAAFAGEVHAEYESSHLQDVAPSIAKGERLLEVYIPLRDPRSPDVVAVAEIYESAETLSSDIRQAKLQSGLVVVALGAIMTSVLYGVVRPASSLIEQQRSELIRRVAQLSSSLRRAQDLKKRLMISGRAVAEAQERLLQQLGAELHDGPVQLIALALLELGNETPATGRAGVWSGPTSLPGRIKERLEEAMSDIRALADGYALPDLGERSLAEVLEIAARKHERRTGTTVDVTCQHLPGVIPKAMTGAIYRFVQEGLNNAFRHAGGRGQAIALTMEGETLVVAVADRGAGFSPGPAHEGLGIGGMRSRVEALGGTFSLETSSGGTTVRAEFKLTQGGGEDV